MTCSNPDLLSEVCREIEALIPCDRVSLARPSADGARFVVTVLSPGDGTASGWEIPREGSCTARTLERRKAVFLDDLRTGPSYPETAVLREQGMRSAALIPVALRDEPFGVLILARRKTGRLAVGGVRLLEQAGGLVAVACASSLEPRAAAPSANRSALAAFSSVSGRIGCEEDLNQICHLVLDAIREHSAFARAVLTLMDEEGNDVQWFFTGLTDAEIDAFHKTRMSVEELRSVLQERNRIGNSYRLDRSAVPGRGGLPETPEPHGEGRSANEPLIMPLYGVGGTLLGTLILDDPRDGVAPTPETLVGLELFIGHMAHVLEKRRLGRAVKRTHSRLRATQEQLMQADKLAAIGQLISGVAHELNNPLSGIMGFAQLLSTEDVDSKTGKHLARIQNEAVRCQKIVQNLLTFSHRHKPEKTIRSLNDTIDSVLELRAYQLQVDDVCVERHYDPSLHPTMLDFHQMQQVVLNLVNNAHQAMMAVTDRERVLRISTGQAGGMVFAHFQDSGTGIPGERLVRIFEPFFTTKESGKGTGLGLSLSLAIVKDHQGTMSAESVLGQGTTIRLELPLIEGAVQSTAEPEQEGRISRTGSLRLLVVDDEDVLTELLTDFLRGEGHEVDQARDGRVALQKATDNDYDVILSDLKMPGLDGQGLYDQLCRIKPDMRQRFIFSTGDLANPHVQTFFQVTGCRYFTKPFRLELVLSVLNQVARDELAA